jgi:hypothetical protein
MNTLKKLKILGTDITVVVFLEYLVDKRQEVEMEMSQTVCQTSCKAKEKVRKLFV